MKNKLKRKQPNNRRGIVFVLAMIFVGMLATITAATATMSNANAQISLSLKQGNQAMSNALSGLEVVNYLLDRMLEPESLDNRSDTTKNPAGFTPVYRLKYDPDSYQELH